MRLRWARLGGGLVLGASIAFLVASAIVLGQRPAGTGYPSIGGLAVDLGLCLVVAGAGILALAGQGVASRKASRIGLGIVAVGGACILATSILLRLGESSLMILLLQAAIGLPITLTGLLITGVSLLGQPGRSVTIGRALVAGVALVAIVFVLTNLRGSGIPVGTILGPVAALTAALLILALGALGYLALSDRWSWR